MRLCLLQVSPRGTSWKENGAAERNVSGHIKITSYDAALEYIKENYPGIDTSNTKAEIHYSSTIQPGYYIPCYRFYLGEAGTTAKTGITQYSVVDITIADNE